MFPIDYSRTIHVAGCEAVRITAGKEYRETNFKEDLKKLYKQAGVAGKQSVFIFKASQVADESKYVHE
jgi:dynein heavy chain